MPDGVCCQDCVPNSGPHEAIGRDLGMLVDQKHASYGPALETSGAALKLLYPDGIKPEQYVHALAFARMWDKWSRIAHDSGAFGESPYEDLIGYLLRMVKMQRELKNG